MKTNKIEINFTPSVSNLKYEIERTNTFIVLTLKKLIKNHLNNYNNRFYK